MSILSVFLGAYSDRKAEFNTDHGILYISAQFGW